MSNLYAEEWKLKVWQQGKEIVNQALLSINSSEYDTSYYERIKPR